MTKKKPRQSWFSRLIEGIVTTVAWSLALGGAAALVAYSYGWDPLIVGSVVAFSSVAVTGALMFAIRYRLLNLDVLERKVGIDINRDGHIGAKQPAKKRAATPDAKEQAILRLLRLILAGKPFTWRAVGKTCKLPRSTYNDVMDGLHEENIMRWKGSTPQQGRELASSKKLKALIAELESRAALPRTDLLGPGRTMEVHQGREEYYIKVEEADSPASIFESRRG